MKLKPTDHPVAGRLVPDKWGDSLMTFREIPGLKIFTSKHAENVLQRLAPEERQLVDSWRETPESLVKNCRDAGLFYGLRGMGVYEVCFSKTASETPSEEQIAAFQYLQANEASISRNIANALLRYYQIARANNEHWFDNSGCPAVQSVAELGPLATLDGVTFTSKSCEGLAVLTFTWDINWDEEHGLHLAVWKDQVVGIGIEDIFDLTPDYPDYLTWNRSHMTETERDHLTRVSACLGERAEEDFNGEYEDDEE